MSIHRVKDLYMSDAEIRTLTGTGSILDGILALKGTILKGSLALLGQIFFLATH